MIMCIARESAASSLDMPRRVAQICPATTGMGASMSATAHEAETGSALAREGVRAGVTMLELRYGLEDKPGVVPSVPFGLQHVLVMFTAMIASPLVIGQLLNLSAELRATMVTGVMLGCGIGTIISALGLGFVGARLPLLLGAYAVYIGPVVAISKEPRASAPRPPR